MKVNVKQMKNSVLKNCQLTIIDLADALGISNGSVKSILKDILGLKRVNPRQRLNIFDGGRRVKVCKKMISDNQSAVKCIISGDESWVYA